MRVALIAPPWLPVPPVAYGGTEAVVDRLARGLQRAGHDVVLAAHPLSTCAVPRSSAPLPPKGCPIGDGVVEALHVLHAYEHLGEVDIVHDHTMLGPLLAPDRPTALIVVTNHGPFDERTRRLYAAVARRAAVVAISENQAASAEQVPVAAVIHHGIDVDEMPLGRGDGGYVLFLGRMAADKGVDRAARLARRAGMKLLIAAKMHEPAERRYFEHDVRPLLGADIEYVGEVDAAAKAELLGGAEALLNPIRWSEPFGMVMLEALACGTPVVTSPLGSAPEIVRHGVTGYLCPDDDAMVAGLRAATGLDRMGCRADARRRFSTQRMVDRHLALYRSVIDAHAPSERGANRQSGDRQSGGRPITTSTSEPRPSIST